jgi:hypothetical protein
MYLLPIWSFFAVHIVAPIANSEFLIEARRLATHEGYPSALGVTQVKKHAIEFHIGIKTYRSTSTVKCKGNIGKILPSFHLKKKKKSYCDHCVLEVKPDLECICRRRVEVWIYQLGQCTL